MHKSKHKKSLPLVKIFVVVLVLSSINALHTGLNNFLEIKSRYLNYYHKKKEELRIVNEVVSKAKAHDSASPKIKPRIGNMKYLPRSSKRIFTLEYARKHYQKNDQMMYWIDNKDQLVEAATSRSLNQDIFFANSYITGYQPFAVPYPWLVSLAVAERTKYQRDEVDFAGDTWLTAEELWLKRRGDCEDHAILIADWLIKLGHDARVVLGKTKRDGHAWVVVFSGDDTYVIEATDKIPKRIPPRQEFVTDLYPKTMFNQKDFWFNSGGETNLNYRSDKWIKTGSFEVVD